MDIQNTKKWVRYSTTEQSVGTLGIVGLAFLIRWLLQPVLEPYGVFHFFIVASLGVQVLFGYRMALVAVVLSLALGEIFFVAPYGEFSHLEDKDLIISLNFVLVILPAIFLLERLQRSLYGRELLGQVNASRMLLALRRENDRMYFGKKVDLSAALIECILTRFEQVLMVKTPGHAPMRGPAFYQIMASEPTPAGKWSDVIEAPVWDELCRPLEESAWQTQRASRDFQLCLHLSHGPQTLSGQVLNFQVHGHQVELWVLGPR